MQVEPHSTAGPNRMKYTYISRSGKKSDYEPFFYPLAPKLNTRRDVQKTGIKMIATYEDHEVAVIYATCLEF